MSGDRPAAEPEWLVAGPAKRHRPPRRRLTWAVLALAAVLAGTGVLVGRAQSDAPSPPNAETSRSPGPTPDPSPWSPPTGGSVTRFPPHLLGVREGWELYGRADGEVVRLQLAAGRMTRTRVPSLDPAGPVSFVVTGGAAVARPRGHAPGYSVRDGRPARPLVDPRLQSGPVLRGPRSDEVWTVRGGGDAVRASLIRLRYDRGQGPVVALQASRLEAIASDAAGGLVVRTTGRTVAYRTVPDGPARYRGTSEQAVTRGTLVAAGANTWVLADCPTTRCPARVVDRGTGRARTLGLTVDHRWLSGSVSPDGRYLALISRFSAGSTSLMMLDLTAEKRDVLPLQLADGADLSTLAWAPDGRRLFVTDRRGTLWVSEPRRGRLRQLGLDLPPLRQLAIEPLR